MDFDLEKSCVSMEFVCGGSLEELLHRQGSLHEQTVMRFARHIVLGLCCFHEHKLIHRDVKPSNIMLEAHTCTAKLTDWIGTGQENVSLMVGKPVGTPLFMAPEVAGLPHQHTFTSDSWALGCTVLYMLTGLLPWENADKLGRTNEFMAMWLTANGRRPPYNSREWSAALSSFVAACFEVDATRRVCAHELCMHTFLLS